MAHSLSSCRGEYCRNDNAHIDQASGFSCLQLFGRKFSPPDKKLLPTVLWPSCNLISVGSSIHSRPIGLCCLALKEDALQELGLKGKLMPSENPSLLPTRPGYSIYLASSAAQAIAAHGIMCKRAFLAAVSTTFGALLWEQERRRSGRYITGDSQSE